MEPPFYKELNDATRRMDKSKLKTMGAFALAMNVLLENGDVSE